MARTRTTKGRMNCPKTKDPDRPTYASCLLKRVTILEVFEGAP